MKELVLLILPFVLQARRFTIVPGNMANSIQQTNEYVNFGNRIPNEAIARQILPRKFVMQDPNKICADLKNKGKCFKNVQYLKMRVTIGQIDDGYAYQLMNKMVSMQKKTEQLMTQKSDDRIRNIVPEYKNEYRTPVFDEENTQGQSQLTQNQFSSKSTNITVPRSRQIQQKRSRIQQPVYKPATTYFTRRIIFYCFVLGECNITGMKRTPFVNKLQTKIETSVTKIFPKPFNLVPKIPNSLNLAKLDIPVISLN